MRLKIPIIMAVLALAVTTIAIADAFSRQTPVCRGDLCQFSFLYEMLPHDVQALEALDGVLNVRSGPWGTLVTYNSSILTGDYGLRAQRWEDTQRVQYSLSYASPDGNPPGLCLLDTDGNVYSYQSHNGQLIRTPQGDYRCPT